MILGIRPLDILVKTLFRTGFETIKDIYLKNLTSCEKEDFLKFEGNAQGFRILTRLQNNRNQGGFQLTYAFLGTFSKYPRASIVAGMKHSNKASEKKFGFFQSEANYFNTIASALGLKKKKNGAWSRHPLAFLTEAADDICYRIIDFEDGYRRGQVSFKEAEESLKRIAFNSDRRDSQKMYARITDERARIERLRAIAINELVLGVVKAFKDNYAEIMNGQYDCDLVSQTRYKAALSEIESLSRTKVYAAPSVVQIENAGFEVLAGLLDRIVPALTRERDKQSGAEKKLVELLPPQFKVGESHYEKLRQASDFVCGMTDSFAVTLYRRLMGIELPRG
jgi:dGTPase